MEQVNQGFDQMTCDVNDYEPHDYVDRVFPFANADGMFKCPTWVKAFLKEKYNLSNVLQIIKEFNFRNVHKSKIHPYFADDVGMEPYSDYEVFLMNQKWKQQNQAFLVRVSTDVGENFELTAGPDTTLAEFKRLMLNQKPYPFFLEYQRDNSSTVKDYMQKYGNQIEVNYNLERFNLRLARWRKKPKDYEETVKIGPFTQGNSIQNLEALVK